MMRAVAGLALGMLASSAQAQGLYATYTYKLVLRTPDYGLAMDIGSDMAKVSEVYTIEVYNAAGVKIGSTITDKVLSSTGCNCTLAVNMTSGGSVPGYANVGDQLTLVVKNKETIWYNNFESSIPAGSEVFRSSKVLPPVGDWGANAQVPVGAFYSGSGDTDRVYDVWADTVNSYCDASEKPGISGRNDDDDSDGLTNMREYQFGTDPTGGTYSEITESWGGAVFPDKPQVSITEQNGNYVVSFNYSAAHIYGVRAIEGTEAVGKDGQDLELYASAANLSAGTSIGKYFYDAENTGTKTYYVKKPTNISGNYMIGLAVDGQLLEYITVAQQPAAVEVTPGSPLEYDTEAAATAAKDIAVVTPSAAVAGVLTGAGAADGYKAAFTVEVQQENGKWVLSAQLTPESWTNLVESAAAATRQIPVAGIAALPMNVTTNFVLTGCTPGFYYSLYSGATVTNITADAETENLNVLCDADGKVEFPMVKKPSEGAGFFSVGPNISPSVEPGDKLVLWPL